MLAEMLAKILAVTIADLHQMRPTPIW